MPSASRTPTRRALLARLAALAACACLLGGAAAGCSTTQEKAERAQARAQHILEQRKEHRKR